MTMKMKIWVMKNDRLKRMPMMIMIKNKTTKMMKRMGMSKQEMKMEICYKKRVFKTMSPLKATLKWSSITY